ncbi:MAG TPA: biotin/lipoyl-containing protein [Candidatus Binataceae bacterium]|jgi:biotin carboxyl carrier protein|nr:biotin/lipoyl-containing protein [Candidatus Binataceae bacterium]
MKLRETSSGRQFEVELERGGPVIKARLDGAAIELPNQPLADGAILIDCGATRVRAFVARIGDSSAVSVGQQSFTFASVRESRGGGRHSLATPLLTAPMPGKVLKIMVGEGDQVAAGQPLITMEAMKMETTLSAEGPARVKRIGVSEGQMVDAGAVLMELSPLDSSKPQSDR